MKLYFFGSEMLGKSDYDPIFIPQWSVEESEELKYLHAVESEMLAVINQFGIDGLAAPQIGFPIQMAVVRLAGKKKMTLLNPRIERMYGSETEYDEGCISCPPGANMCPVARMQFIHVVARSLERPEVERDWNFSGWDARIVQHELDHLAGTFFFERAELVEKAKVLERFHQWKRTLKQSREFGLPETRRNKWQSNHIPGAAYPSSPLLRAGR